MAKKQQYATQELAEVAQKPDVSVISGEVGAVGTNIFSGYIDVDYEDKWRNLSTRLKLIDEMTFSDATCAAVLSAIKNPLKSAKWFIVPASDDPKDVEIAKFIEDALFNKLDGGFDNFLHEALTCFEYGFSLFEVVFKVENGSVYWSKFAPRIQTSLLKWGIKGQPWVDGHPAGITQLINNTDDVKDDKKKAYQPEIPWNKLMIFSWNATGHNYEGRSIFRNGFQHWYYKQFLYRVSGMSAEKHGVGVPYMKMSKAATKKDVKAAENLLRNMRANEQTFAVFDEKVMEFGILTPSTKGQSDLIESMVSHHDRKLYDSILAGFLNLTTGEGGSNALSADQSSFFLRGLQSAANFVQNVIDQKIQELAYLNFDRQKAYPKLKSSDIGQISLDERVGSIALAREKGLISISDEDEKWIREILNMPKMLKNDASVSPRVDPSTQPQGNMPIPQAMSEQTTVRHASYAEEYQPSPREVAFMKRIADYENFLQSQYKRVESLVIQVEKDIAKGLKDIYERADTERLDGRLVLARTPKNTQLQRDAIDLIRAKSGRLYRFIFKNANNKDPIFMRNLFNKTRSMAQEAVQKDESLLADLYIDERKFDSFVKGYKSNIEGVLYNDPRRMEEKVIQNFGNQVSVDLAIQQGDGVSFNRNILKLSLLSHPRGAYNAMQYDMNTDRGFTFYKVLTPKSVMKSLDPKGTTAGLLFMIFTVAQLNKRINELSGGDNTDVVNGLGLHHNAITYFLPIASDQLDIEEKVSAAQRRQLKTDLN